MTVTGKSELCNSSIYFKAAFFCLCFYIVVREMVDNETTFREYYVQLFKYSNSNANRTSRADSEKCLLNELLIQLSASTLLTRCFIMLHVAEFAESSYTAVTKYVSCSLDSHFTPK